MGPSLSCQNDSDPAFHAGRQLGIIRGLGALYGRWSDMVMLVF